MPAAAKLTKQRQARRQMALARLRARRWKQHEGAERLAQSVWAESHPVERRTR